MAITAEWFCRCDIGLHLFGARLSALFPGFNLTLGLFGAVQESIGLISRFDDLAMVSQPIEQRRSHLGVAKHTRPLGKRQIRGDHDAGVFVEL